MGIADFIRDSAVKKRNLQWFIQRYSETGKFELPPSSKRVDGKMKVVGYNVIGSGFDASHLQTRASVFDHEKFGFEKTSDFVNAKQKNQKYVVPSSVLLKENYEVSESTFIAKTPEEFEMANSQKWTGEKLSSKRTDQYWDFLTRFKKANQFKIETSQKI